MHGKGEKMEITKDTKIVDLMNEYEWLIDQAKKEYPELEQVDTPFGRMMAKKLTLEGAAKMANVDVDEIINEIKSFIENHNDQQK